MNKLTLSIVAVAALIVVGLSANAADAADFRWHFGGRGVHVGIGTVHHGHYGIHRTWHPPWPHYDWHDTSHLDWHPTVIRRHGNHYHIIPGHWYVHRTGHWDLHVGGHH